MKREEAQKTLEYCLFLAAEENFCRRPKVNNSIILQRLYLYYAEMPDKKRESLDELARRYLDRIGKVLPRNLWEQPMKVSFQSLPDGGTRIDFISKKFILRLSAYYGGMKNVRFRMQLGTRLNGESVGSQS